MFQVRFLNPSRSKSQRIGHRIEADFLRDKILRGRECSVSIAVTRMTTNRQIDGFSHHAEDNRVFADIVAGPQRVVTNLVSRAQSRTALATVDVIGLPHFFSDDLTES